MRSSDKRATAKRSIPRHGTASELGHQLTSAKKIQNIFRWQTIYYTIDPRTGEISTSSHANNLSDVIRWIIKLYCGEKKKNNPSRRRRSKRPILKIHCRKELKRPGRKKNLVFVLVIESENQPSLLIQRK